MTLIVKKDEALDPMDIGFFGSIAIMPAANGLAHLIEKLGFGAAGSAPVIALAAN
jgi:hypothetical protein